MERQPTGRHFVAVFLLLWLGTQLTACETDPKADAMPADDAIDLTHPDVLPTEIGPEAVDVAPDLLPDDQAPDDSMTDSESNDGAADVEVFEPGCVRYVRLDGQPDGDAMSWQTATNRIQAAIDAAFEAAQQGDGTCEVWVAQGSYAIYQSAPTDTVQLLSGVALYGGFAGDETAREQRDWRAYPTILDGHYNGGGRVRHVVTGSGSIVLDGFSIVHGGLPYPQSCYPWVCDSMVVDVYNGGGLFLTDSTAVVANCNFEGNYATCSAGAIYRAQSTLTVTNCRFYNNHASIMAGALSATGGMVTLQQSDFDQNTAAHTSYDPCGDSGYIGAVQVRDAPLTVSECQFTGNLSLYGGGALNADTATIVDSVFSDNEVWWEGNCGGLEISGGTIERCTISGNEAGLYDSWGGGICAYHGVEIRDSTIVDNHAGQSGGGVFGTGTIRNSLIAYNSTSAYAVSYGGGVNGLAVENCIVHGNRAQYGAGADTTSIRSSTFVNNGGGCGVFHFQHGLARRGR